MKGNRESPAQLENQTKPLVYIRRITRSTMKEKNSILLAGTGIRIISTVACGLIPIKTHYFDHPKRFIKRINAIYVFSIIYRYGHIYRYSDILLKNVNFFSICLFCCNHTCY